MRHVKGNYSHTLKYYYIKRNKEQCERWNDIVNKVIDGLEKGLVGDDIVNELMTSGYRILLEDTRATKMKEKEIK